MSRERAAIALIVLALVGAPARSRAQNRNGLWIPNAGTGTVTLIGTDGVVRGEFPVGGGPRGAAIDSAGNAWIARWSVNGIVRIAADGSRIDSFTPGVTSKTLAIDRDGDVWITNQSLDSVTKMSPSGVVLGEFATGRAPRVVAFDANGDAWITCKLSAEVFKLDSQGSFLGRFPVGAGPRGIAFGLDGSAWVANLKSNTVTKLSSSGALIGEISVAPGPAGIAVDRRGNVWVANCLSDHVTVLAPDGSIVRTLPTLPEGGVGPLNVAPDADGNIWILCKVSSVAIRYDLDGRVIGRVVLDPTTRPEPFGDLTGYQRASILRASEDDDGDGFTNGDESRRGFNLFLASDPAALAGNVNTRTGPATDVVFVNGSSGDDSRRVVLARRQPFALRVAVSPAGPHPAPFSLYARVGEVDSTTITVQPFGLGTAAIPTPLNDSIPGVFTLFNTLDHRGALGRPLFSGGPAPARFLYPRGVNVPIVVTLQGFIRDDGSPTGRGLSITNAVTAEVR